MAFTTSKVREIVGRECKFVYHIPEHVCKIDTHIVKEVLYYSDNTTGKNVRIVENYKKPVWVTKKVYRDHRDKKEAEHLSRVDEIRTTENAVVQNVAPRVGGRYNAFCDLRKLRSSQYVYGLDVTAAVHIKKLYQDTYPDLNSEFEVAVLDIETDVHLNELVMVSISTKKKTVTIISKKLFSNINYPDKDYEKIRTRLHAMYNEHIPKTKITEHTTIEYRFVDNEMECVKEVFMVAHEWEPDFLAIWSISYDMPQMMAICDKYDVAYTDVFCDPKIPKHLHHFKYNPAAGSRQTASGVHKSPDIEMQWHTFDVTASFYPIDAMSAHRYIRVGGKVIPGGYSLNNILKSTLGKEYMKLRIGDSKSKKLAGVSWHNYMVRNLPLEYIIYNQWDNISILELDEETTDLRQTLPMLSGPSSFKIFNSGPRRIVDAMLFFCLSKGYVLGTKPSVIEEVESLGLGGWIVLLPSSRTAPRGAKVFEGTDILSNVRMLTADVDQKSGYPSDGMASNSSKDTTVRELLSIAGISKDVFMLQNINLFFGKVNAIDYGVSMLNLPDLTTLHKKIKEIR